MEILYGWVKNIVCFTIFMTALENFLPNGKYEKYIRLFAGMVMILIVIQPLTLGLGLEGKIAGYFEEYSFQNQASDFQGSLEAAEEKRLSQLIDGYEQAVAQDMAQIAEGAGLSVIKIQPYLEENQESEDFGTVKQVSAVFQGKSADYYEETAEFRRKLTDYYEVEDQYVEIQFKNG